MGWSPQLHLQGNLPQTQETQDLARIPLPPTKELNNKKERKKRLALFWGSPISTAEAYKLCATALDPESPQGPPGPVSGSSTSTLGLTQKLAFK